MERELASHTISQHLEPLCPRDNHKMKFDPDGARWQQGVDSASFKVATYHCGFGGCTVRYAEEHGYCTIVRAPDLPVFVGGTRGQHAAMPDSQYLGLSQSQIGWQRI